MLATIFCAGAYVGPECNGTRDRHLFTWIGWFGVVFSIISLMGWVLGTLQWQALEVLSINANAGETIIEWNAFNYRNEFPLGHGNYTAGLTLLLLPWMIGLTLTQPRWKRLFWLAATALVGFVLFTAGSRGALLGLIAAGAAALFFLTLRRTIRPSHMMGLGVAALLVVTLLGLSQPRVRQLIQDFGQSKELNSGDLQRWSMLEAGLAMGADHPLVGQGPGVTPLTYPSYRAQLEGGVESALQLHSTPLQIWADLGVVGLSLSIALLGIVGVRCWRYARMTPDRTDTTGRGILVGSAAISTVAYLTFALTDFQLDVPIFAGFLAINLGVILASTRPQVESRTFEPVFSARALRVGAVLAVVLVTLPVLWSVGHETLARRAHSHAVDRLERGDVAGFDTGIQRAMQWSPKERLLPRFRGYRDASALLPDNGSGNRDRTRDAGHRLLPPIADRQRRPGDRPLQSWMASA